MAASDTDLILNLVLYAQLQAEAAGDNPAAVLKAMVLASGPALASGGGRLISGSVNGKSFAYQVDAKLSASDLMTALRGALAYVGTYTADELTAMLNVPRSSWSQVGLGGLCLGYHS